MNLLFCAFVFVLGCCIGSFVNVLIYRLPREISIVSPGSRCPNCERPIAWYDNIPLLSWVFLGGACRNCGWRIALTYPLVELISGLSFVLIFVGYMVLGLRTGMPSLSSGPELADWMVLALHFWLISALLAASGVDFQRSVIPLSVTNASIAAGLIAHSIFPGPMLWKISSTVAGFAVGGGVGLVVSALLLRLGVFKPSFGTKYEKGFAGRGRRKRAKSSKPTPEPDRRNSEHPGPGKSSVRKEMLSEILYLGPAICLGIVGLAVARSDWGLALEWRQLLSNAHVNAFCASLFGLLVGAGVVWFTRILGSLAFGREAMGLGDVHLMAAGGAILGCMGPVLAFFIAPFYGLLAVVLSAARQRSGELPYGPWLSAGLLTAMLFEDKIWAYLEPGLAGLWQLLGSG